MTIDEFNAIREVEVIAAAAANQLPRADQHRIFAFTRALYHDVDITDVVQDAPEVNAERILSFWRWGQKLSSIPMVRVFNPPAAAGGWRQDSSIVEVICKDMPFLVDSLTLALGRLGHEVHLLMHPVLQVERDAKGQLLKLSGGQSESWIHLSVNRLPESTLASLAEEIQRVLEDVKVAVADWLPMRKTLQMSLDELSPGEEVDFLKWLDDDHFVYLGVRTYRLSADGSAIEATQEESLGLMRNPNFHVFGMSHVLDQLAPAVREFLLRSERLFINKSRTRSTVHRGGPLDLIGVKLVNEAGEFAGFRLFMGLFTSVAYARTAEDIPYLRRKVEAVVARSGLAPKSHSGKALIHILNNYPRDDLFQISPEELYPIARGILLLAERQRTALFVWRDPFNRFFSCLIYTPRERYDTRLRQRMIALIEQELGGACTDFTTGLSDSPLVRIQAVIEIPSGHIRTPDLVALERRLIEAARGWDEKLADALVIAHGQNRGLELREAYLRAFPATYRETVSPVQAVTDLTYVDKVCQHGGMELSVQTVAGEPARLDLRFFQRDTPMALSDILPRLENLGLRVLSEVPYELTPRAGGSVWVQEIATEFRSGPLPGFETNRNAFLAACEALWQGQGEDDGFNRLILSAGLSAREVAVLRSYGKYLQQTGFSHSLAFIQDTLAAHPQLAARLIALFHARFDPELSNTSPAEVTNSIEQALDKVTSLSEDEVLRRYLNAINCTLRTNYYQDKPYLSFKLDSQKIIGLPLPRPLVEIWVHSPRVEGVHLRGGRVARGGIRWSDRRDDFRTEVLGLMKAQMVKNSVIVPVGSKGGFYCRQLPAEAKAQSAEVVACYQTFIRGLLDITDNRTHDGHIVPPPKVRRHDGDDPYLVVAADKGTAKFSDIANALSEEYGFWLGDAFASGGSVGYDHKHMGITARGAWEAVKRHFRELGRDIQSTSFTCIGVGDMAGDVFGNGMLRSPHTLLVAAFNHKHIFIDPNPDAAVSFAERQRLFELPGSQWSDYRAELVSAGGGVFERSAKSIPISQEMAQRFGLTAEKLAPAELVQALLRAKVDLLYLGGIGTFVKASAETHTEVNDRANDALRVNANEVGAAVIGEGANLGVTARARIEYALSGGRINSDAIDNSAGVDTSDHEVNIKIAFASEIAAGRLTHSDRNQLLASMTEEVAALVLRDNYLQTQILSMEQAQASALLPAHAALMRKLEADGRLNRKVEHLPDDAELTTRTSLTRPELAILLAYSKMMIFDALVATDLPDTPEVAAELVSYFPAPMQTKYLAAIKAHQLRREIISTILANDVVNRMGSTFVNELMTRTGASLPDVMRAWRVVRQAFDLPSRWLAIEALDNKQAASQQIMALNEIARLATGAAQSLLHVSKKPFNMSEAQKLLATGLDGLGRDNLVTMAKAPEVMLIASATGQSTKVAAAIYQALEQKLHISQLYAATDKANMTGRWQREAYLGLLDDLRTAHRRLAIHILNHHNGQLPSWEIEAGDSLVRLANLAQEAVANPELSLLTVLVRQVQSLTA